MIEATSGERFEVKAFEEYDQLEGEQRLIYGIACIASDLRFPLFREEILLACEDLSNTALYALERLVARRLLVSGRAGYQARHRRIAEIAVDGMRSSGQLLAPYSGLLRACAARYKLCRAEDAGDKAGDGPNEPHANGPQLLGGRCQSALR
jgi:hypothetical protein